jgi:hypothetical protein
VISINDKVFEIEDHKVSIKKRPGRCLINCTCTNHTMWNNSNAMCYHILAVILYLADNKFYDKIDKLLLDYKNIQNLKLKMDADIVINDLQNLRRIK